VDVLNPSQIAEFNRNGCLLGERIISDSEIDELRSELDRVIRKGQEKEGFAPDEPKPVLISNLSGRADSPVWQIVNIWQTSPAFERLIFNPQLSRGVSQLTGESDLQIWHDQIQYKPAHHGGVNNWHQDAPYWPILRPLEDPGMPITAWVALDDVDEDNGCMWMVPGSHRWGNHIKYLEGNPLDRFHEMGNDFTPPADAQVREVKRVPWPVKKGAVSFHHSLTWHGSGKNISDRPRRAIAIHMITGRATFFAAGNHVMKKFIALGDGESMTRADPRYFPHLCRRGEPVLAREMTHA
jgi:ectoine hydroxylase-related dioxygenase (phytanoyl-CoA dioxygenase family)